MLNEQHLKTWIEETFDQLVAHLSDFVAIPSVAEPGKDGLPYGPACAQMLSFIEALIAEQSLDTECFEGQIVIGTKTGRRGKTSIGIACHGDVVPAQGPWERDPFTLWQKGDWLVGRGATDNKGATLVALWAIRYLREANIPLNSDIKLLVGSAEEIGMPDMERFVCVHDRPTFTLVPDAGFPVCYGEKGRIGLSMTTQLGETNLLNFGSDNFSNSVAAHALARIAIGSDVASQLARLNELDHIDATIEEGVLIIHSHGLARHSAFPEKGRDAIGQLARALLLAGAVEGEDARRALAFIADSTVDVHGSGLGIARRDDESGPLTAVLSTASTDAGTLTIGFDIRYPVTFEGDPIIRTLKDAASRHGFEISALEHSPKSRTPVTPLVEELCSIANSVHQTDDRPYTMGGGTYARKLQPAVAYGLGTPSIPITPPFPVGEGRAHQANEAVYIPRLKRGIEIYVKALITIDHYLTGER